MSISYIIVNRSRKEYIECPDRMHNEEHRLFKTWVAPLIEMLTTRYDTDNEYFGRWYNTEWEIAADYTEIYDIAKGLLDKKVPRKDGNGYEWVQDKKEESDQWMDITKDIVDEYIKYLRYWLLNESL